jgi:hypothetical protein
MIDGILNFTYNESLICYLQDDLINVDAVSGITRPNYLNNNILYKTISDYKIANPVIDALMHFLTVQP